MRCISWFQDLTKDSAPSRCSCAASASISTPAAAIFSSVAAQSPPSLAIPPRTLPWSAKARRVCSGLVLIVSGAASAPQQNVSGALGSLVPELGGESGRERVRQDVEISWAAVLF